MKLKKKINWLAPIHTALSRTMFCFFLSPRVCLHQLCSLYESLASPLYDLLHRFTLFVVATVIELLSRVHLLYYHMDCSLQAPLSMEFSRQES